MRYRRLPIEIESPEERGYSTIRHNLTESSTTDATLADYGVDLPADLVLAYGDHRGLPELRDLIAADAGCSASDVLCTPGAAAALFFVATALLEPGDHALVEHTNYATNLETPRLLGADVEVLELRIDDGFRLDTDRVARAVGPRTQLVSVTVPHNPTGTVISRADLDALVDLAERRDLWLLVDETYRDMARDPLPVAASLSDRAISVGSLSKTYGLPGLRLGWITTRHPELQERFLAAKEQVVICGSTLDEEAARQVLARRDEHLRRIRADVAGRADTVTSWLRDQDWLDAVAPQGGVVCFPRLRPGVVDDVDGFYRTLNEDGTYVGEGHWFDADRRHFRLGFGWPSPDELERGLASLAAAADAVRA